MSKNTHTHSNIHDTNCHRNYGNPSKDAISTRQIKRMILTMTIWENQLLPMTRPV